MHLLLHSSVQLGFLFSTNAVIPSFLSLVPNVRWNSLFSVARPSSRVVS